MNKNRFKGLTIKILTLFSSIIIIVAVLMLISVNLVTSQQYKKFIVDSDVIIARDYSVLLARYYEMNDSTWSNIETFLDSIWHTTRGMMDNMMNQSMNNNAPMKPFGSNNSDSNRLVILDESGVIIADTENIKKGEHHPQEHWKEGIQITVGVKHVGTVLYGSMIEPVLNPIDKNFLNSVNWTITLFTAITVTLALLIGFFFVSTMISPLKKLSLAFNLISEGQTDIQVPVVSRDEISILAENFNKMSSRLDEARQRRNRITEDIAHEIRTPITTIQGELEAILDGIYPLDRGVLENVYKDTVVLSGIINDLQLLESLEVNRLILDLKETSINEIIGEVALSFKTIALEKKVKLKIHLEEELTPVNLDRRRIRQILNNLVSNAIRHSAEEGIIEIEVAKRLNRGIEIRVRDHGEGITEENLDRIFERFYRIDESRSRSNGGSGLGLSICKSIVEAHGGTIRAESAPGKGTSIIFTIP